MREALTLLIVTLVGTGSVVGTGREASASKAAPPNVAGKWLGTITFGAVKLRIGFEVSPAREGGYTGSMRSIDQSGVGIPVTAVRWSGDSLRLEMDVIHSAYEGKFTTDGDTIEGNWLQSGTTTPLVVQRVDQLPEIVRPQTPKKPYPYLEEDVAYANSAAQVHIAGTLTLPKGKGPFPAVLLIAGSGPLDRDETVHFHKPFLVLADHLTRQGLAVLRVDKRGVGQTTGEFADATILDLAADGLAGVAYLKSRKEIDPQRIGLIGHSQGGTVGAIMAARSPDVASFVTMAALGQNNAEIIIFQKSLAAKARGADAEGLALLRTWLERVYAVLREDTDDATAAQKIRALHATLTAAEKEKLGLPDSRLDDEIADQVRRPWRYDLRHDPCAVLQKVRCSVLALGAEKDMRVPAKENLAGIEQALKAGGNMRFTVREFPGLNHGFQAQQSEETMSPLVLQTISDWILAQTGTVQRNAQ